MRKVRVLVVACLTIVAMLAGSETAGAQTRTDGWLERSMDREVARLVISPLQAAAFRAFPQPQSQQRGWAQRHPRLLGALVGFGAGFLIGFLPGDDGVLDDFDASFNGLVIGGVGALTGAVIAEVATK